MIYSILCFLKAFETLNVKVVPNDSFKFGAERNNNITGSYHRFHWAMEICLQSYRTNLTEFVLFQPNVDTDKRQLMFTNYNCPKHSTNLSNFHSISFIFIYSRLEISWTRISWILKTRSVFLNQKYIFIAFSNYNLAWDTFLQVKITRSAN